MRVFEMSVRDPITSLECIASDISYNIACDYLSQKLGEENFIRIENNPSNPNITNIVFKQRTFVYDENRGLLLGE